MRVFCYGGGGGRRALRGIYGIMRVSWGSKCLIAIWAVLEIRVPL